MATTNYDVNYDDERFGQVESDKSQALTELEQTYGGIIGNTDKYYQEQIDAAKQWGETQSQLQQEQTDFTIEQIEQQKDQAHKDYVKEQSGAYADWQKQSNQYGTAAEKMASSGMTNTGFSESSQVGMYNAYQNRVTTARESYNQAILNYNNASKDARLQNNSVLAEIAYQSLQQQLQLSLEGFQYKNDLVLEQANKKVELENTYYNRYLDVLNQINTENAMAEEIRQFDESVRQFEQNYQLQVKEYEEGIRQFNEEIARLREKDKQEYELEIKNLELKKQQLEEEKRQFEESQKLKREQLAEEKRQFNKQYALQKSKSSGSSSKKSSSSGSAKNTKSSSSSSSGSSSTKKSSTPTNNMASILALGYGPISESRLASLLSSGQVKRTLKNGQWYYSKNTTSTKYNRLKNMELSK